jgi:hypothetical protein
MREIKTRRNDIADALLPAAQYHEHTVTGDDFDNDRSGGNGPGDYYGYTVDDDVAARWDAGLAACRDAEVAPRSHAGLLMRWRTMFGDDTPMPPELAQHANA